MTQNDPPQWAERTVAVSALVPYETNPRTISDAAYGRLKASIQELGYHQRCIVQPDMRLIGGHQRLRVFKELGITEITVLVPDRELTEKEFKRLLIQDNVPFGEFDWPKLQTDFAFDDLKDWGLPLDWLAKAKPPFDDAAAEDTPALQAKVVSRTGDLWLLGSHRLLCGDSTEPTSVAHLMDGALANMVFTSPPYAQQRDYDSEIGDWDKLMNGVFSLIPGTVSTQIFVNLGLIHRENEWIDYWRNWLDYMKSIDYRRFGWYVWDQGSGLPGDWNGRFAPSFEFIFHFNKEIKKPNKIMDKKAESIEYGHGGTMRGKDGKVRKISSPENCLQTMKIPDTVTRITREMSRKITSHPAMFPVSLPRHYIQAFTDVGDAIYDPFMGSGTTIIATEQTGRIAYGMEISPAYCDLIVRRWMQFANKEAILESGETFEAVENSRG